MKKIAFSIILLIVIVISSFYIPHYLKNIENQLNIKLNEIEENIKDNNYKLANFNIQQLSLYWANKQDVITLFVNNDQIDNLTYSLSKLRAFLKYKDNSEFYSCLDYIRALIKSIYDDEIPVLNNIF